MSSSIPMLLVMLLAHVGKDSNSRSQMFLKTGLPKDFHRDIHRKKTVLKLLSDKVSGLKACIFI